MKKTSLAIIAMAFVGSAHAGTAAKSKYFYQTDAQKHQVTPTLSHMNNRMKFGNSVGTTSTRGNGLDVKYEYGFNDMFSVGASIGYQSAKMETAGSTTKTDIKGLSDLDLFFKGQNTLIEGSSLHYGADLTASLGDGSRDTDKQSVMTGGYALVPYLGYQWMMGPCIFGAKVSTEMDLGKRSYKNKATAGGTYKDKGYNDTTLAAFYEHHMDSIVLGAELSYTSRSSLESELNGTTTTTSAGNLMGIKLYPTYMLNEMVTLVGSVSYQKHMEDGQTSWNGTSGSATTIDSASDYQVSLGGRFTF
ncbi:MAG: hypothetical protein K1X29_04190 [Bdellovibrionales bacterium]|nr:hypothetical protein [Bdellovibrionales bacterium]